MRASRWLLGISATALVTVGGFAAGCSSSSSPAPASAEDASSEAAAPANDAGSSTTCHVDASLAAFAATDAAAAGCAVCVQTMCTDAISSCSSSCACISLFNCLADAGVSGSDLSSNSGAFSACVPADIMKAMQLLQDPGINSVYTCFTATCSDQCSAVLPTPEGGATDSGSAAADAGAASDGGAAADGG
jgi:hypothetical protein